MMKKLYWLFVIAPMICTGCVQWPGVAARNQTVNDGPPPQIDPKLPGAAEQATTSAPSVSQRRQQQQQQQQQQQPMAPVSVQRPPVTADEVTPENAYGIGQAVRHEMEHDRNHCPLHGLANCQQCGSAWPR